MKKIKQKYYINLTKSTPYIQLLLKSVETMSEKIKQIKDTHNSEIKRLNDEFARTKEIAENNFSQEHVNERKCFVKS
jgi:hypothetical protein